MKLVRIIISEQTINASWMSNNTQDALSKALQGNCYQQTTGYSFTTPELFTFKELKRIACPQEYAAAEIQAALAGLDLVKLGNIKVATDVVGDIDNKYIAEEYRK